MRTRKDKEYNDCSDIAEMMHIGTEHCSPQETNPAPRIHHHNVISYNFGAGSLFTYFEPECDSLDDVAEFIDVLHQQIRNTFKMATICFYVGSENGRIHIHTLSSDIPRKYFENCGFKNLNIMYVCDWNERCEVFSVSSLGRLASVLYDHNLFGWNKHYRGCNMAQPPY